MFNWPTGRIVGAVIVSLEPILWACVAVVAFAVIVKTARIIRG